MSNGKNNKPIWNKNQIAKVKRYLKSKEWADNLKNIQDKWKEDEEREKQEEIDWWNRIKDEPFMLFN
jgi:hypothetical protein